MATAHQADEAGAGHESSQHASWMASLLGIATAWIVKHPLTVVWLSLGVALLSIAVVFSGLQFKTSRLDLLNPASEFNQRWLAYLDEFGEGDDAIIVAQGADAAKVKEAIDAVAAGLQRPGMPVESVLSVRDLSTLRAKGLHYLSSKELQQLDEGLQKLSEYSEKLGGLNELLAGLSKLNGKTQEILRQPTVPSAARTALAKQYQKIIANIAEENDSSGSVSPGEIQKGIAQLRDGMKQFEPAYLTADEGRIAYVLFRLKPVKNEFTRGADAIGRVRKMLVDLNQRHPSVKLGLTGMPVLEFDEMKSSQNDMSVSTWLSLAGVGLMFWASYGGLRHTGVAIAVLLLGMAWAFGYLTLAVGHLNILSVSFTAILVGGGIDFSIHYVAHYLEGQSRGETVEASLVHTARNVGPGVITGGVTTAMAFMTTSLTDFVGVAELGLIAGGGLLLCLVATVVVLPALMVLSDRGRTNRQQPKLIPVAVWAAPSFKAPYFVLVLTLVITAVLGAGFQWLRYDDNLLNLQAKSMESVKLERDILSTNDRSLWFAVSTAQSAADARTLKMRLEALEGVDHVEEPGSLLPESGVEKRKRISGIASRLNRLVKVDFDAAAGSAPDLVREVQSATRLVVALEGDKSPTAQGWTAFGTAIANLAPGSSMNVMLRDLRSIARPEPPEVADIPRPIAERCIGRTGKFMIRIYPKGNIWDREELTKFVRALEKVDPHVTGHPIQTFYASAQMRKAYVHASIYSIIAVTFLLLIDFGSITNTLVAMMPLCLGIIQMFGAMGWLGIPLNPASMIALPLIMGIGVDDGVHLMHDYRLQKKRYRLANSTALAVMLTSATSMVGFAATILSPHQGLRSLGQVLTLGIFTCLASSLWALPAVLNIMSRHRPEESDESEKLETTEDEESLADGVMDEDEEMATTHYVPPPHHRRAAPIFQGLMSDD
jgi:hopanoid biosynthesis associated RND transporter like protein HpnN